MHKPHLDQLKNMSRNLVSFTWAAYVISSFFHVATAFPLSLLPRTIFRSELINWPHRRNSISDSKSHFQSVLICHRSWRKNGSFTPVSALGVQFFHPDAAEPAVVVSTVYWDNVKAKILTVIGVEFVVILIGIIILGSFVNQLPKFLSDLTKSEEIDGIEEPRKIPVQPLMTGFLCSSFTKTSKSSTAHSFQSPSINLSKFLVCLLIDSIGTISVAVPLLGELSDVIWAPIAATALRSIYGGSNVIFVLEFLEQILPFTDIIPLATLCWAIESFYADSDLAKLLGIGQCASLKSPLSNADSSINQSLDGQK